MNDTPAPLTRRARRAARQDKAAVIATPTFRRWAYGLAIASIVAAIGAGWLPPGASVYLLPLAAALFFVNENGDPK
ncbi:hypothetical protein K8F61_18540 [Microbacterium resistens]|uniref:Uncharacterized protein n=1 Tax=Microbacterium resistens TaxID=156977 RepID=A0ABY3RUL6_9MICO|nr:hypothetical protein [Microbacterium resistens]UGS26584.1 hypothetical protein K8F61_18540 [Microbacterium resistens]